MIAGDRAARRGDLDVPGVAAAVAAVGQGVAGNDEAGRGAVDGLHEDGRLHLRAIQHVVGHDEAVAGGC